MQLLDFPKRITLELSSVCNLECVMCPRKYLKSTGTLMCRDLFEKIINELGGKSIEAIVPFFRGESLMHPAFKDMIRFIREKISAKIQLATNALLLNKEMTNFLLEMEIDFISFSIDALYKETYNKIRLNGDFDLVLLNIKQFLKQKKTLQKLTTVQVSATSNQYNQNEIEAFITYWKDRVDRIRIYPEHSSEGKFGSLKSAFEQKLDNRTPCRKLFSEMVILSDGRVSVCNHDWNSEALSGYTNIQNESLTSVWQGKEYQALRALHLTGEWNDISPCGPCDHWQTMDIDQNRIGELIT